ncbi:MAG: hypoxanthine-guanine phosphoribosyltransferase [Neisseriaceae bacterium]|jgi:hypoxanthine phosphoribosyltransferase
MQLSYDKALAIIENSEVLYSEDELNKRIFLLAKQIEQEIIGEIPIFLNVMNGGLFFAASILSQISGPFISDYVHASRYGNSISGTSQITWHRRPSMQNIYGKTVYIIDDVLDEGYTLAEIKKNLLDFGAKSCKTIVLIDKNINKEKPIIAEYVGFNAPNHFLFGYGMDIYGLYRQLPDIYIYKV